MNDTRIKKIIKELEVCHIPVTGDNISTQSLFSVGGTLTEEEAESALTRIKIEEQANLHKLPISQLIWRLNKALKEGKLLYEDRAVRAADWGGLLFSGNMRIILGSDKNYIRVNINNLTIQES